MYARRFVECEKWRKEFGGGVDHLTKYFEYTEKPKVFEYYPQYYHKTDKVPYTLSLSLSFSHTHTLSLSHTHSLTHTHTLPLCTLSPWT